LATPLLAACVREEKDMARRIGYSHFDPVEHGLVMH
jgi:hypothetical protein